MFSNKKQIYLLAFTISLSLVASRIEAIYVPPPEQEKVSDYSKSTGIRTGFGEELSRSPLTLLAPQTYVGQTTSTNPTFVWIIGSNISSNNLDFRLFEFDSQGDIKQRGLPIKVNSLGKIVILPFPENQLPLTIGKKYLWQVAIRQPEGNWIIQKAEFRVVQMPSDLRQILDRLNNRTEKIEKYANHGFWYEALKESFSLSEPHKLGNLAKTLVQSLAESESIYLSNSLSPEEYQLIEKRINSLKFISSYH